MNKEIYSSIPWSRLKLRAVADVFFLIDPTQTTLDAAKYRKPILLNETGADFCRLALQGKTEDEVLQTLSDLYKGSEGFEQAEFLVDMGQFVESLAAAFESKTEH